MTQAARDYEREFLVPDDPLAPEENLVWRANVLSRAASDPGFAAALKQIFYTDFEFAFNAFFWAFDPREAASSIGADRPFILFDMQKDLLTRVAGAVNDQRDLLLYKKSRDLGGTWCIVSYALWEWLQPRSGMTWLLGSRKENLVDASGATDTLFFVLRYNLYRLPPWLRPDGYEKHRDDNALRIVNPATASMIRGESTNANYGSGGRYRAILLDEFAKWGNLDQAAWEAAAQASPCRIGLSTAKGANNHFAALISKRIPHKIEVLELHWKNDPRKNEEWYEKQKGRMTEEEIAQELEGSLAGSGGKRFYGDFNRSLHKAPKTVVPGTDVIVGWDFGFHHPAIVATQIDPIGSWWWQHVIMGREVFIKEFAKYCHKRLLEWYGELSRFTFYGDISGSHRSDKSHLTSIEVVQEITGIPVAHGPIVREKINESIRTMLMDLVPGGKPRIGIAEYESDNLLPDFIETESNDIMFEMMEGGIHFPQGDHGDVDDWEKDGYYEHPMDAVGIIAWHLFRNTTKPKKLSRMMTNIAKRNNKLRDTYRQIRSGGRNAGIYNRGARGTR